MDNRFMPPPPNGARNNMPPPPPPPKRELPNEVPAEEDAFAVPNVGSAASSATNVPPQPSFTPPRDFPPRFNNAATQQTQVVTNADALTREERSVASFENEEASKEKTPLDWKPILYWGGFGVSVVLIILFIYLLFI